MPGSDQRGQQAHPQGLKSAAKNRVAKNRLAKNRVGATSLPSNKFSTQFLLVATALPRRIASLGFSLLRCDIDLWSVKRFLIGGEGLQTHPLSAA